MGPFSHYSLAAKLEAQLQPAEREAYAWGAVAPDIRYLANLPRDHTHLEPGRVRELLACHPALRSFLLGYQVHLLIDEVDVAETLWAAFPLNLARPVLGRRLSLQQMTMLVEMYYLQAGVVGARLSGELNPVLADLGITPDQARVYQQGLQEYFDARSLEVALAAFQKIGMIQNTRVEKYLKAYRAMQKRKWLSTLIMWSIKNSRLDAQVQAHVLSGMRAQVVEQKPAERMD